MLAGSAGISPIKLANVLMFIARFGILLYVAFSFVTFVLIVLCAVSAILGLGRAAPAA